ncbi:MAG: DUF3899 domain-containing protein [Firmicutes bacterium]|nr:DUF3899 domain-containing protein [Bacillota bacterium]
MKKNTLKRGIKYLITFLACGTLTYLYIALRDFAQAELIEQYRMLCDAFLLSGLLPVLLGLLLALSNAGALDGISYLVGRAVRMLIPGSKRKEERFFDYVERKRDSSVRGYGFLFMAGGCFLAVSMVFYFLFYNLYTP